MVSLFATKSLDSLHADAESGGLRRELRAFDLVLLGVGAIVGTGIFVLTGRAAAMNGGPAISISFVIAGVAAALAALCYSEMAAMIPVAGSAYTYAYATMGELVAWMIGWDLVLEYLVGAATISVGWSGYVAAFSRHFLGYEFPTEWSTSPIAWNHTTHSFHATGAIVNLPAMIVSLLVTLILIAGISKTARFNSVTVIMKVIVILLFIAFAASHVDPKNWVPFVPKNTGEFGQFGWSGVMQGASIVFFSYIGFDAIATTAQESKNPKRDLPIGILVSLAICSVLYIAVALILTGVVPYAELSVPNPISLGIQVTGIKWLQFAVDVGAIAGLSSVLLVTLMGQPRVFFSMAKDGLLPAWAAKIHPRYGTPHLTTAFAGILCAIIGGVFPIEVLGELMSIGTLFAFTLVSFGVMILRIRRPDFERKFRVPGGPYLVPLASVAVSCFLISMATVGTIVRLFVWMALGLVIYFFYGKHHSHLRNAQRIP